MTKKIKIKNMSDERQAVVGIPSFEAGEVKEVEAEQADLLLHNVSFQAVEVSEPKSKK